MGATNRYHNRISTVSGSRVLSVFTLMEPKTLATFVLVALFIIAIEIQLYVLWRLWKLVAIDLHVTRVQLRERGIMLPKLEVEE